jgi:uncharacterized protein (TIGR01777 family)
MKVVVTGATGFIGQPLVARLRGRGDDVTALVRDVGRARERLGDVRAVQAELETPGPWCDELAGAEAIVHLAGEPIADKRWDARVKQQIRDSRVESTRTIVEAIGKASSRPRVLVTASGADYYAFADREHGFDDDEVTEDDPAADTFLGRLCRDWEAEALAAQPLGVRVVCMRTGLVLGKHGGMLARARRPFDLFAGGKLGSGRQWMSWIHLDDVVAGYVAAISDERYRGPINLVTDSTRNADFARALGKALGKPSWLPVPAFAIKAAVGSELAEYVLEGRRVVPAKLRALGFTWRYPTLEEALAAAV